MLLTILFNFVFLVIDVCYSDQLPSINKKCDCGRGNSDIEERIVGGKISVPHAFPWQVGLFLDNYLICGGSLINDRYVLTAGHCIAGFNQDNMTVRLGLHDLINDDTSVKISVDKLILHGNFRKISENDVYTSDIGLVKLSSPIKYTNNIRPLCLPREDENRDGETVKVIGWGLVKHKRQHSNYLRQLDLTVIPYDTCKKTNIGYYLDETMTCAYAKFEDSCQGDSGGSLLYQRYDNKYELFGIVSWGYKCASKYPGVYVNTAVFLNWIHNNTADAVYCKNE